MKRIFTLCCVECDFVYEREAKEICPRCECRDIEVIEVTEEI